MHIGLEATATVTIAELRIAECRLVP